MKEAPCRNLKQDLTFAPSDICDPNDLFEGLRFDSDVHSTMLVCHLRVQELKSVHGISMIYAPVIKFVSN